METLVPARPTPIRMDRHDNATGGGSFVLVDGRGRALAQILFQATPAPNDEWLSTEEAESFAEWILTAAKNNPPYDGHA